MSEALLKMINVTGTKGKFRLKDICMEIQSGFIYGLVGANGAGKTTLFKYLVDESRKYEGEILFEGLSLKENRNSTMEKIGYVSEDRDFFNGLSTKENAGILGCMYENFDSKIFEAMMQKMGVSRNARYDTLSRGEKLKFQLAFEMAHSPKLYLLDEITVGMDPVFRKEVFDILHKLVESEEVSILMTSHIESEMRKHIDYIGQMKDGMLQGFVEGIEI